MKFTLLSVKNISFKVIFTFPMVKTEQVIWISSKIYLVWGKKYVNLHKIYASSLKIYHFLGNIYLVWGRKYVNLHKIYAYGSKNIFFKVIFTFPMVKITEKLIWILSKIYASGLKIYHFLGNIYLVLRYLYLMTLKPCIKVNFN